ncbi:MAG: chromosome partitioning protein ParB, partial [Gammaproteobacteria bacterium]|nr:chromosome partitioning protein ParB [Gammaproteobacteria bacterium]
EISSRGLSAREAERLVRRLRTGDEARGAVAATPRKDPDVARLERELSERLGSKVEIRTRAAGAGNITVHFATLDELDGLLARLR